MLLVNSNQARWEYDIHSLVKAFFPEKTVKVITPETKEAPARSEEDICMELEISDADVRLVFCAAAGGEDGSCRHLPIAAETIGKPETENAEYRMSFVTENVSGQKNEFKRFLYKSLADICGRELPWGNLTGIRPTKIAMGMLEEGKTKEEIYEVFQKEHCVSGEKTALSYDIAVREREILADIHYKEGYSLYIGIPFCPTTCLYCSFTSYPICAHKDKVEAYIDCLIEEMKETAVICRDKILDTVYIGGGTPTTLEAHQLHRLIQNLKEIFDFSTVQEFTVEAGRADSITKEKLEVLYRHGVSRISVNPQTMKDETLRIIGRKHTVQQTVEAFRMARECGFDNINMDIILGLPGEMAEDVAETIAAIKELSPDSLTVHSLAVKRASGLRQYIEEKGMPLLSNTDETMEIARRGALDMDMEPYYLYRQKNMAGNFENVGYARAGKAGIYNILIMEEKQTIVALGAGSITKRVFEDGRIERCDNVKDVSLYIQKIHEMIGRKKELFADFK